MDDKLSDLASCLQDMASLRLLLSELNFDFEDKPVNNSNWTKDQKGMVLRARIVAKKGNYRIFYIQTTTDSLKDWKGIASKIIKKEFGQCMICSHNPEGFKWVFSSQKLKMFPLTGTARIRPRRRARNDMPPACATFRHERRKRTGPECKRRAARANSARRAAAVLNSLTPVRRRAPPYPPPSR